MQIWVYNQSTNQRESIEVGEESITIGRDDTNDIVLKSTFVSRRHARIRRLDSGYVIESLGLNGLTVANREVAAKASTKLNLGDEIRLGEFSLYMMEPARRLGMEHREASPQRRVIELEQALHAELLERLNLRVTGQQGADSQHVALIKQSLAQIIAAHRDEVDAEMVEHLVRQYLWRRIVTELSRRATGRLMYSYGFEETDIVEPKHEEAILRLVEEVIAAEKLKLAPGGFKDDLAAVEAQRWQGRAAELTARLDGAARDYLVARMLSKEIEDVVLGYGPLQDLLEMPNVNEIMVVGKDHIYIEKDGALQKTGRSFFSDEIVQSIIERIITPVGRRIDRSSPLVDARLSDGSRVNAIISPLSLSGPTLTIRKFAQVPFTIDDLVEMQTLTPAAATFCKACVLGRKNMLISGGTASGKTTTLNVLAGFIPAGERIVTIEDSAELALPQEHVVRLETRPANVEGRGAYAIRDLVKNALRMRPDRIIVGEVRGAEALDMLAAMNTGHDGSLTTIHANNPQDTMLRLETMVLMAVEMPVRAIREQIVAALDVVVQIARMQDGRRRVSHISEIVGIDPNGQDIVLEDIFVLRAGRNERPEQARLRHTGYIPPFAEQLIADGHMGIEVFT